MKEVIQTTRFGEIYEEIIVFPNGIYGFEGFKSWAIMHECDQKLHWLQSAKEADLCLPMIRANMIHPEAEEGLYYIISIPADIKEMTANTLAPIFISQSKGEQIIGSGSVNFKIFELLRKISTL